jgi:alkylhydroperoxidase/carboxymuconolactone decarboxylase family protein YurZ
LCVSERDVIEGEYQARRLFGDARYERTRDPERQTHRRRLLALADEVVFGKVYSGPELSIQQRALCTISALTVLGQTTQLRAHIGGALNVGVAPATIAAVIEQMAMYAGFPAALNAMQVADECFAAALEPSGPPRSNGSGPA